MLPIPIFNSQVTEQISTATFDPLFKQGQCEGIIQRYKLEKPVTAKVAGDIKDKRRDTLIHPIPFSEDSEWIYKLLADRVGRMNQFGYDFDLSGIYGDLQLLEYNEGGHYDWHMDIGPGIAAHRKLSIIVQLSNPDEYEGGEVRFKASEKEHILPKDQGLLCVFPSYILHKVEPITKGKRYSLVTWVMSHRRFR